RAVGPDGAAPPPAGLGRAPVRGPCAAPAAPVALDATPSRDERVQLPGLAVHAHTPRLDQLVRLAPRRDTGPREIGVQTHARYCPRMPHYVTLMTRTSQGIAGLPAWRKRSEEGQPLVEAAGGKLVGPVWPRGRDGGADTRQPPA